MKTHRFLGTVAVGVFAFGLALSGTASAEPEGKNVVAAAKSSQARVAAKPVRKRPRVYIRTIASGIPVPIEQYRGFTTTTSPMIVIRRGDFKIVRADDPARPE